MVHSLVATTLLYHCITKATIDNTYMNRCGCIPLKLYSPKPFSVPHRKRLWLTFHSSSQWLQLPPTELIKVLKVWYHGFRRIQTTYLKFISISMYLYLHLYHLQIYIWYIQTCLNPSMYINPISKSMHIYLKISQIQKWQIFNLLNFIWKLKLPGNHSKKKKTHTHTHNSNYW